MAKRVKQVGPALKTREEMEAVVKAIAWDTRLRDGL